MSRGAYKPRSDSLAGKVITFFQNNPEEELYSTDVAAKWQVRSDNAARMLTPAIEAGFLTRTVDDAGRHFYTPGPNIAAVTMHAAPPAPAPEPPQAISATLESTPDRIVVEIHLHIHTAEA